MKSIPEQLKQARIGKKISQKEFGQKLNFPQSHISAIETEKVDPRLTSVIEMGRVLGLELMLVPTPLILAVRSLIHGPSQKPLWWSIDEEDDEENTSEDTEEEIR